MGRLSDERLDAMRQQIEDCCSIHSFGERIDTLIAEIADEVIEKLEIDIDSDDVDYVLPALHDAIGY